MASLPLHPRPGTRHLVTAPIAFGCPNPKLPTVTAQPRPSFPREFQSRLSACPASWPPGGPWPTPGMGCCPSVFTHSFHLGKHFLSSFLLFLMKTKPRYSWSRFQPRCTLARVCPRLIIRSHKHDLEAPTMAPHSLWFNS